MAENFNIKGLFTFTGNPIVDNGMAVLANIAGKDNLGEITPNDIMTNIDTFFETIKFQYNDENANDKDKKHSKKKLKQHLTGLYTTNHYLHGINNKSKYLINATFTVKEKDKFVETIEKSNPSFFIKLIDDRKVKYLIFKKDKTYLEKEIFLEFLDSLSLPEYKLKSYSSIPIETNEEYFISFKSELKKILNNTSNILTNDERKENKNICNFCGKKSDIKLSKDIFPLSSPIEDSNLGLLYSCKYCYLATIFYFFNLINFKTEEALKKNRSGMYFFYHFSHPKVMIEYSKQQIKKLENESLASLQTVIGGKYSTAFNHLYEKINSLKTIPLYQPSVTIYFLLNDNRGATYEQFSLPSGLLNFWLTLQTPEGKKEWHEIHSQIKSSIDYNDFVNGDLAIHKFKKNKKETLITYLKEVAIMNEKLISASEELSKNLADYFKKWFETKSKKRENWIEEFYDYFQLHKPHEFFNDLLHMNNQYFKWTEGANLLPISSMKLLLEDFKKFNLLFGLIEYFMLNNMCQEEKEKYFAYQNKKMNKVEDK